MAEAGEFRFTIDGYTPETLPMARLAEYLSQLATLFGEKQAVHFTTGEPDGAVPLIRVEADALPRVRDRLSAVGRGEGPVEAMRAYRSINERLRLDDTSATLTGSRGADVLPFPGKDDAAELRHVRQLGSIDGEVIRVGGQGDDVRVILRAEDAILTEILASRPVAKALARHLFEPVRLHGLGRWSRRRDGRWVLEGLKVERFDVLLDDTLTEALSALHLLGTRRDGSAEASSGPRGGGTDG